MNTKANVMISEHIEKVAGTVGIAARDMDYVYDDGSSKWRYMGGREYTITDMLTAILSKGQEGWVAGRFNHGAQEGDSPWFTLAKRMKLNDGRWFVTEMEYSYEASYEEAVRLHRAINSSGRVSGEWF